MRRPPALRVVEREARIYARLWRGIAFSMFVQPLLYLAAMGVGLGKLVDAHSGSVGGVDYLAFVAPGLMVASAAQLAAGDSLWPVLGGVKWTRHFFGIVATPIAPGDVYGGYVIWIALRSAFGAAAFLAIAAPLGAVPSVWGILAIPAAALCGAAFCALLAAFTITQETDLSFPMIMRLGIVPLFLFSGTFFPVSELPAGLRVVAAVSPLWHGVSLARMATTGSFEPLAALGHVAFLVACIAVGGAIGVRTFTRRLAA